MLPMATCRYFVDSATPRSPRVEMGSAGGFLTKSNFCNGVAKTHGKIKKKNFFCSDKSLSANFD
jgi:glucan phosphorylase